MHDVNYFHVKTPETFDKVLMYNQKQKSIKIQVSQTSQQSLT